MALEISVEPRVPAARVLIPVSAELALEKTPLEESAVLLRPAALWLRYGEVRSEIPAAALEIVPVPLPDLLQGAVAVALASVPCPDKLPLPAARPRTPSELLAAAAAEPLEVARHGALRTEERTPEPCPPPGSELVAPVPLLCELTPPCTLRETAPAPLLRTPPELAERAAPVLGDVVKGLEPPAYEEVVLEAADLRTPPPEVLTALWLCGLMVRVLGLEETLGRAPPSCRLV